MPAFGAGFTVTLNVVVAIPQPFVAVNVIVEFPADTPVTTPDWSTVAAAGVLLFQIPAELPTLLLNRIVEPAHTVFGPLITPAF